MKMQSLSTVSGGLENNGFDDIEAKRSNTNNNPIMAEEILLSKHDGKYKQKASDFGQSGQMSQPGLELRFQHLDFRIKDKQILSDISGTASPGRVLAVMGPSGSGKTTLLNILGGRIQCSRCRATIGGLPLTKKTRRNISYVLQQDIFFPNLTLRQTLMYSAELRLPESMPTQNKKEIVEGLIEQLDMKKCTKTIIGDNMNRGLSGGEKKRANIANELLTDPAVLLLDEPTSGLDSSTAYALTLSLKQYAVQTGKTVLMTIHQPSVQMFHQFDDVLLLSGGRIAYYGPPEEVLTHFGELGYNCDAAHYNPADFILDVVKSGSDAAERLIELTNKKRKQMSNCPIMSRDSDKMIDDVFITNNGNLPKSEPKLNGFHKKDPELGIEGTEERSSVEEEPRKRWATSFAKQLRVLTERSFVQGKYRYLSTLKFVKTVGVALICGLVWWQAGRGSLSEGGVVDLSGALFFLMLFNSFNSLFDVLVVFPSEREVVNKERMSGSYRLSSYYVAKTASEFPLALVLPTLSTFIFYWMAGLNGYNEAWAFFGTWGVMILVTLTSQSLGMFVSTATMDFDHALVLAIFIMISFMLLGGFYVRNLPTWLDWSKFVSFFTFGYSLMLQLEFNSDERVICDPDYSSYPSCQPSGSTNETLYVAYSDILESYGATIRPWVSCVALISSMIIFRVLGYLLLRLFHKPIVK